MTYVTPCRQPGAQPDMWHAEGWAAKERTRAAVDACLGCQVREQCLDAALGFEAGGAFRWGVWGGLTAEQRADLAKRATA